MERNLLTTSEVKNKIILEALTQDKVQSFLHSSPALLDNARDIGGICTVVIRCRANNHS
jgi:hypothetical protein